MSANRRLERVAELLKREISEILRRELSVAEIGLLTVNDVVVAKDLRTAAVFLGFVGTKEQKKNAPARLAERAPRIQLQLGSVLRLKFTPQLTFQLDDSVERGNRILAIMDQLEPPAPPSPPH